MKKQCIYWCFTLPVIKDFWSCDTKVFTSDDVKNMLGKGGIKEWIFQCESGNESDYLHFQGWVKLGKKMRLSEVMKIIPSGHWEPSRGPAAEEYAMKSDTRIDGPWCFPYRYMGEDIIKELRDWQKKVVDIVEGDVDKRKIYWFWETTGNVGKSALCKYLVWWYKATLIGGKTADAMFSAVEGAKSAKPVYLIDIPRNGGNKVAYNAIEMLKNGIGFSPKYESKMYMAPPAHVIVFANSPPDMSCLSADRWVVEYIGDVILLDI